MDLRYLLPAALALVPLELPAGGGAGGALTGEEPETLAWLEFDFSPEQLEADYRSTLAGETIPARNQLSLGALDRTLLTAGMFVPILFQAAPPAPAPLPEETPEQAAPSPADLALDERLRKLEEENAELKQRLADLAPAIDPVDPWEAPDWPEVRPKSKRKLRFSFLPNNAAAAESRSLIPLDVPYHPRFRPFTRAAMDTQFSGRMAPARAQSLKQQQRFFQNTVKALGAGIESPEFAGIRLEVERSMLRGEVNPRYAAQYVADVVEVFRTYERMKRFGLATGIPRPISVDAFRRDSDRMFHWASQVSEARRQLHAER